MEACQLEAWHCFLATKFTIYGHMWQAAVQRQISNLPLFQSYIDLFFIFTTRCFWKVFSFIMNKPWTAGNLTAGKQSIKFIKLNISNTANLSPPSEVQLEHFQHRCQNGTAHKLTVVSYQLPACYLENGNQILVGKASSFHVLNLNSGYILL
jgi:hypothetical protein